MSDKQKRTTRQEFMAAWEGVVKDMRDGTVVGSGVSEVASRLGLKLATVQQRATKFRKKYQVPLSKMPRSGGARFNAQAAQAELEAIRQSLNGGGETNSEGENQTETTDTE